ncbi:RNA polymerase sigma factor [Glaciihabitans sp. dw_435]|uniref:RNA polymerase sigma factor n=1 Tax=Glaciihabitans sp. dw_435 TaxID=2720081 RepID=UPI0027DC58DE|nr:RNA polymerase sigma factor [Glaciihabitans sp. dw_435]
MNISKPGIGQATGVATGGSSASRSALADAPDATLTARAADGDVAAFEVLVRRHGPVMRAYAAKLLGSTQESGDVVQETFILAWKRLPEVADGSVVRSWLMRILTNKTIDRIRARKPHVDIDEWDAPAPATQSPAHIVEVRMQFDALSAAVNALPQMQRECWVLKEIGGESYAEIAEHLSLPLATVRGALARARQTLLHEMEAWR